MIASVVVTLDNHAETFQETIDEISRIPCLSLGLTEAVAHRLPVMIDSPDADALEEITHRLQQCRGVAFVDVVFVHFENESHRTTVADSGKPTHP
jgi:nitrate reductase NapAB chaperone NapD